MRQNIALATETNKILHGMRAASRLKSIFWLLIFFLSVGSSIYTYFYFIEPRIQQIKTVYETNIAPLQGASRGIQDFLKNFSPASSTPK